jgi:hypothetical protein
VGHYANTGITGTRTDTVGARWGGSAYCAHEHGDVNLSLATDATTPLSCLNFCFALDVDSTCGKEARRNVWDSRIWLWKLSSYVLQHCKNITGITGIPHTPPIGKHQVPIPIPLPRTAHDPTEN